MAEENPSPAPSPNLKGTRPGTTEGFPPLMALSATPNELCREAKTAEREAVAAAAAEPEAPPPPPLNSTRVAKYPREDTMAEEVAGERE